MWQAQAGGDAVSAENSGAWHPQVRLAGLPVELVPMIGTLPLATLFDAAARAERIGVGGDEALVAAGIIGRDAYMRRLAAWLGLHFTTLDGEDDSPDDLTPQPQALAAGFVAIRRTPSGLLIAAAPQGRRIRDLVRLARTLPATGATLCLTSPERLEAYVAAARRPAAGGGRGLRPQATRAGPVGGGPPPAAISAGGDGGRDRAGRADGGRAPPKPSCRSCCRSSFSAGSRCAAWR